MQPFHTPSDATYKIWPRLANWPQRYSSFRHSRASNSKVNSLIQPEIKFVWAFMPVLVTSNFDDDSIKNERASMETAFSPLKVYRKFVRSSRAAYSVASDPIWPKFELVWDFIHVLVTCKYKKDRIKKQLRKGGDIVFPIISQWGLSVAMETRVLIQSAPKPYAVFPPPQWCYT